MLMDDCFSRLYYQGILVPIKFKIYTRRVFCCTQNMNGVQPTSILAGDPLVDEYFLTFSRLEFQHMISTRA